MASIRLHLRVALSAAFLLLASNGCDEPADDDLSVGSGADTAAFFVDAAVESGLDFVHFNGMSGRFYMVENMAPGVGVIDFDNDGDLDVYVPQGHLLGDDVTPEQALFPWRAEGAPIDRLYRNDLTVAPDGTRRLRFVDVTLASGLVADGYGVGVATGDIDNDGWTDLYVTNFGPNRMYRNNGDGTFSDISESSGTDDPWWSVSAAFVDVDRDGWLDLYVGDYLNYSLAKDKDCFGSTGVEDYCAPKSYRPVPDRLYRNLGQGRFEDVTAASGVAGELGAALGVVTIDSDRDGHVEIYVANDGLPNVHWVGQPDGTLRNVALMGGAALNAAGKAEASMGVDAGDFDNDGDEDLFMAHLNGETNTLYLNDGSGRFDDRSVATAIGPPSRSYTGFGAAWLDFDNDGALDILVVNGAVQSLEAQVRQGEIYPLHQLNQLFRQTEPGLFEEVTEQAGAVFSLSEVSRGLALGDLDNDGDMDALISNSAGPLRLLLNQVGQKNHWMGFRLVDAVSGRDMLGAAVVLESGDGVMRYGRVRSDGSYASARDPRVLFGLGRQREVERAVVTWPDGSREAFTGLATDRWHTLVVGGGVVLPEGGE